MRLLSFLIPQDTGVSVRKRVIKIMKDICVMQPDFPKTSEICVKIIRRIGDEEGIKVQATIAIAVCEQSFPVLSKCVRLTLCVIPPSLATGDECFPRAVVHPASRRVSTTGRCLSGGSPTSLQWLGIYLRTGYAV